MQAIRVGDFSIRMSSDRLGIEGKIATASTRSWPPTSAWRNSSRRVGQRVGKEGKTKQRVRFGLSSGAWGEMESSVNTLIDDLLWPTTEVTRAIAAVAQGDLLETVPLDVDGRPLQGEFLRSATIVNTHDQAARRVHLGGNARRARGRDAGQAGRPGAGAGGNRRVEGLTESVNSMASNLTAQVRNIADVTIAVANGDLSKKITVGRARRDFAAQGSHQHDGGPAPLVRLGGDARRARGSAPTASLAARPSCRASPAPGRI